MVKSFIQNEDGVAMIEYGLLAALIAVVCISSVTNLGSSLSGMFSNLASAVTNNTKGS